MENTEIIKLVRSIDVAPADLSGFIEALKKGKPALPPAPAAMAGQEYGEVLDYDTE